MKAQEWATRQEDAAGELAAIAKAKEVLESGVKVFLEVSSRHPLLQSAVQPVVYVVAGDQFFSTV